MNVDPSAAESRLVYLVALFSSFVEAVPLFSEAQASLLHDQLESTYNVVLTPLMLPVLDAAPTDARGVLRDYFVSSLFLYNSLRKFDAFCSFRFFGPADDEKIQSFFASVHSELSLPDLVHALHTSSHPRLAVVLMEAVSLRLQELYSTTQAVAGSSFDQLFKSFKRGQSPVRISLVTERESLERFSWTFLHPLASVADTPVSNSRPVSFLRRQPADAQSFSSRLWARLSVDFPSYVSSAASDEQVKLFLHLVVRHAARTHCGPLANAALWEVPRIYSLLASVFRDEVLSCVPETSSPPKLRNQKRSKLHSSLAALCGQTGPISKATLNGNEPLSLQTLKSITALLRLFSHLPCFYPVAVKLVDLRLFVRVCVVLGFLLQPPASQTVHEEMSRAISQSRAALASLVDRIAAADPSNFVVAVDDCGSPLAGSGVFLAYYRAGLSVLLVHSGSDQAQRSVVSVLEELRSKPAPVDVMCAVFGATADLLGAFEKRAIANKVVKRRARKHVIRDLDAESELQTTIVLPAWFLDALLPLCHALSLRGTEGDLESAAAVVQLGRSLLSSAVSSTSAVEAVASLLSPLCRVLLASSNAQEHLRTLVSAVSRIQPPISTEDFGWILSKAYSFAAHGDSSFLVVLLTNASLQQLHMIIEHALFEIGRKELPEAAALSLVPALVAVRSLHLLFENVDLALRYQVIASHAGSIISGVSSLVSQLSCAPSPQSEAHASTRNEVVVESLAVLSRLTSEKFVTLSLRHLGLIVQVASSSIAVSERLSKFAEFPSQIADGVFAAVYRLLWTLLKHRPTFVFKCIGAYLLPLKGTVSSCLVTLHVALLVAL